MIPAANATFSFHSPFLQLRPMRRCEQKRDTPEKECIQGFFTAKPIWIQSTKNYFLIV